MNRRRQQLVRVGDRITDEALMRDWLASMAPKRVTVERLSLKDPFCVSSEAVSRNRERAA